MKTYSVSELLKQIKYDALKYIAELKQKPFELIENRNIAVIVCKN